MIDVYLASVSCSETTEVTAFLLDISRQSPSGFRRTYPAIPVDAGEASTAIVSLSVACIVNGAMILITCTANRPGHTVIYMHRPLQRRSKTARSGRF